MQIVILIGNLGRDPELTYSTNGTPICKFPLATTKKWADKSSGELREKTEWHRVVVFGKQGETASKHLSKGSQVCVTGELQTSKYEKNGQDHYSTEVICNQVRFLGGGSSNGSQGGQTNTSSTRQQPAARSSGPAPAPATANAGPIDDFEDDDIPF